MNLQKKKPRLTLEQYCEICKKLKETHKTLVYLTTLFTNDCIEESGLPFFVYATVLGMIPRNQNLRALLVQLALEENEGLKHEDVEKMYHGD